MGDVEYKVSLNFEEIQEEFKPFTPYNIIKDIKRQKLRKEELARIAQNIAEELKMGENRPSYQVIYWGEERKANYSKLRSDDKERGEGKSYGYRCIVLVDNINHFGYLLHIYRHGHGENENISASDRNKLKELVDEYIKELNGGQK